MDEREQEKEVERMEPKKPIKRTGRVKRKVRRKETKRMKQKVLVEEKKLILCGNEDGLSQRDDQLDYSGSRDVFRDFVLVILIVEFIYLQSKPLIDLLNPQDFGRFVGMDEIEQMNRSSLYISKYVNILPVKDKTSNQFWGKIFRRNAEKLRNQKEIGIHPALKQFIDLEYLGKSKEIFQSLRVKIIDRVYLNKLFDFMVSRLIKTSKF